MRRYLVAAVLVALALPTLAAAKGPSSVSISGPGLDGALSIRGDGEGSTPLGTLTIASGFFEQVFGQSPDPTFSTRPRGVLGPRYTAVYLVPGPDGIRSRIVQHLYPYAKPVALTHMRQGQRFWEVDTTHGGWYRAPATLKRMLVRVGLPPRPP